jgi:hypothetical protein
MGRVTTPSVGPSAPPNGDGRGRFSVDESNRVESLEGLMPSAPPLLTILFLVHTYRPPQRSGTRRTSPTNRPAALRRPSRPLGSHLLMMSSPSRRLVARGGRRRSSRRAGAVGAAATSRDGGRGFTKIRTMRPCLALSPMCITMVPSYPDSIVIVQFCSRVTAYLPIRVLCFCLFNPDLNSCIIFLYLKEPGMVHSRFPLFYLQFLFCVITCRREQ